jgi:hypothetical protein
MFDLGEIRYLIGEANKRMITLKEKYLRLVPQLIKPSIFDEGEPE